MSETTKFKFKLLSDNVPDVQDGGLLTADFARGYEAGVRAALERAKARIIEDNGLAHIALGPSRAIEIIDNILAGRA